MAINYSPPIRTIFTDISGPFMVQQHFGRCAFFEMRFMECLEAYGADQAMQKCLAQRADFNECIAQRNQQRRVAAMREERERQRKEKGLGRKDPRAYAEPPPRDSYTFMDQN
ncbi:unnamed protein product [Bemisia tabaci]|uniref:NADH dehydrogenase [ubiquinone] iron-sulfur protein 5 n=1 Tax=Bemisia tabaci TaxID=7038 RepID=A0A9P0F521_BEMTA|nr:unnamed protein product [Bemisia tabaci]